MRSDVLAVAFGALVLLSGEGVSATETNVCLPPLPGELDTEAECRAVLGDAPLPELRQDVHVTACNFAREIWSGWLMSCSVTNNSAETIESIHYVARYFDGTELVAVAGLGVGEDHTLSVGGLNIASGATERVSLFSGKAQPEHSDVASVVVQIRVTYVSAPGSPVPR